MDTPLSSSSVSCQSFHQENRDMVICNSMKRSNVSLFHEKCNFLLRITEFQVAALRFGSAVIIHKYESLDKTWLP